MPSILKLPLLIGVVFGLSVYGQGQAEEYSKPVGKDYPQQVFWGDTHLHTRNSSDAYSLGNMNLSAADAYRFAQGQELTAQNGMRVKLRRPLDFLVVTDHAEYLGAYYRFDVEDPIVTETEAGRRWFGYMEANTPENRYADFVASINEPQRIGPLPEESRRLIWQDVVRTADDYNKPGRFTTFAGYEWTSMIEGNNLHRVVVFKDGFAKVGKMVPFSAQDSTDPEDLWQALSEYEQETGGQVMAIAHNGNLSNGMMFSPETVDGVAIDQGYAEMRSRWEPLYEVTQVKGDGEAHATLSPNDQFADFETWDEDNIARTEKKEDWMLPREYARGALKLGLQHEEKLGVNPFKFGLIGSTDNHTAFATAAEDNFFGKFAESEPGPQRSENAMAHDRLWENWRIVASGYAAVWARENTREELFAAMKRREVYATTGSRISVRFFGGWDYRFGVTNRPDYLDNAYAKGVPMGGDLVAAPTGKSPVFIAVAAKDPDGANLDRLQVIKGWLDADGELREHVYDVAWSGEREPDPETGELPPVGSTVDIDNASYTNEIGSVQLATVWTDPDFDPDERAFYYLRVLEIPKPRWTAYDAAYFDFEPAEDIPMIIQDRAYTSPIWYTP